MIYKTVKLGKLLVSAGVIDDAQLSVALEKQKNSTKKLGEILVEEGFVSEKHLIASLAKQLDIPYIDLNTIEINTQMASVIPESIARVNNLVPLRKERDTLTIAMSDPLDYGSIRNIESFTKCNIAVVISEKAKIENKIRLLYTFQKATEAVRELSESALITEVVKASETDTSEPIIRFINNMFDNAVLLKASDIHIEPLADKLRIRFRVDGHLRTYMETGSDITQSVISRIKIIGNMNIAEKRAPQDGRISYTIAGREIDLRISVLPCVFGEKIVIRITNALSFALRLDNLGFSADSLKTFGKMIRRPYGIILVTGATGSGKSTTLYSALLEIVREDINIVTVENPVEMVIQGITQVEVNPKAGLTFASALRSILRQDPDVIMVGEIRDEETARIAASAAITGHLVFSTLHTYDAPSSVVRLVDMGIEPYMVASSVIGILSQRLMRKICPNCRREYAASPTELDVLGLERTASVNLYKGEGCPQCHFTGYRGRTAVAEMMPITIALKEAIHNKASLDKLRAIALSEGMIPLTDDAKAKVLAGEITFEEMLGTVTAQDEIEPSPIR